MKDEENLIIIRQDILGVIGTFIKLSSTFYLFHRLVVINFPSQNSTMYLYRSVSFMYLIMLIIIIIKLNIDSLRGADQLCRTDDFSNILLLFI